MIFFTQALEGCRTDGEYRNVLKDACTSIGTENRIGAKPSPGLLFFKTVGIKPAHKKYIGPGKTTRGAPPPIKAYWWDSDQSRSVDKTGGYLPLFRRPYSWVHGGRDERTVVTP